MYGQGSDRNPNMDGPGPTPPPPPPPQRPGYYVPPPRRGYFTNRPTRVVIGPRPTNTSRGQGGRIRGWQGGLYRGRGRGRGRIRMMSRTDFLKDEKSLERTAPVMKCYLTKMTKRPTLNLFGQKLRIFCAKCVSTGAVTSCKSIYGHCDEYDEYALCARTAHKICSLCQKQVRGWSGKGQCRLCNELSCGDCMLGRGIDRWCASCEWLIDILSPHIGWCQEVVSYTHWLPITMHDVYWLKSLPRIKMDHDSMKYSFGGDYRFRWVDTRTLRAEARRKQRDLCKLQEPTIKKGRWVIKKNKKGPKYQKKRKKALKRSNNLDASTMSAIYQEHGHRRAHERNDHWWGDIQSESIDWEMNGALMDTRYIQQFYGRI